MLVKVRYLRDVRTPPLQVGKAGKVYFRDHRVARQLINGGYAVEVKKRKRSKSEDKTNDAEQGTDITS